MDSLYNITRQEALTGGFNWTGGDTFSVALIGTGYTFDVGDQYLSDVIAEATVLARQDLTTLAATLGAAGADPVTITGVTGTVDALVIYQNTGSDATSKLVAYIDTGSNIPSTYSAGTVSIIWDTSSGNGIFRI